MVGLDKRKMERFSLALPALLTVMDDHENHAPIECMTENICAGGAYFKIQNPFPIGTKMKIDVILPVDKLSNFKGTKSRIDVSGSVIRTEEEGMALRFDKRYNISPYHLDA